MEIFATTLPLAKYIKQCRDAERFIGFCRECRNYGRSWACPPFEYDIEPMLAYSHATIVACRIPTPASDTPLSEGATIMRPARVITEKTLLQLEKEFEGRAFTFAGTCLHCPEGTCSRVHNEPCRHPELVRPSLEAVGFDVSATARLAGVEILWGRDNCLPPYLTLVTALFHNHPAETVERRLNHLFSEHHP